MTATRNQWQRRDRWRCQVETHLRRLHELLTAIEPDGKPLRPPGPKGKLPELPESVARAWGLEPRIPQEGPF